MLPALARIMPLALATPLLAACGVVAGVLSASGGPCTTSAQYGTCSYPPYTVNQDMWRPAAGSKSTLTAKSAAQWKVSTYQPPGVAVRSYPNVTENLGQPISAYTTIEATFAETMPTGGREEAAFDIWVNGAPGTSNTAHMIEVMVWTDTHRTRPAGTLTARATIGGQTFNVYECPTSACVGHPYYAFRLTQNEAAGQVDLLSALKWLTANGLVPASDPVTQVQDGWEIGNTGGITETFAMTNYALSVTAGG
ncbi:MAG TPA: hypothetical protein VGS19_02785 [Streptosporangiaceae bacterium]|nr:hypothetical protein [Streptosporangiaceae bacterium]